MSPESRPFKNSNLFSNHYLEKLVKDGPEWRQEAGLAEAFAKIKELYEHKARVLEKNRKKLGIDLACREPGEAQRAEFEGSAGKLTPLRERIRQTDELIDEVVYKLYGLTEEEIGIVKGKAN